MDQARQEAAVGRRARPGGVAHDAIDPAQLGRLEDRRLVLGKIRLRELRTFGGGIARADDQLADAEREHEPLRFWTVNG